MPPVPGKPCFQLELNPWRMGFSGLIAASALIRICYYYKQQLLLPTTIHVTIQFHLSEEGVGDGF